MVTRTIVWVRFSNLSLEFYDEDLLIQMGSYLGQVVKVDLTILSIVEICKCFCGGGPS